jgi:ribose-phosphate pyrophosphokinase
MNIIGNVEGCNAILVDDLIDTAGTICNGATALKQRGAKAVYAACTHAVLSGPARERLAQAELEKLLITDTIPQVNDASLNKLDVVSVAPMLGEAIWRIQSNESVSALFGLHGNGKAVPDSNTIVQPELDLF